MPRLQPWVPRLQPVLPRPHPSACPGERQPAPCGATAGARGGRGVPLVRQHLGSVRPPLNGGASGAGRGGAGPGVAWGAAVCEPVCSVCVCCGGAKGGWGGESAVGGGGGWGLCGRMCTYTACTIQPPAGQNWGLSSTLYSRSDYKYIRGGPLRCAFALLHTRCTHSQYGPPSVGP